MNDQGDAHCPAKEGRGPTPAGQGHRPERPGDGAHPQWLGSGPHGDALASPGRRPASWSALTAARPTGGDMVLLRAGVEVYDGWLDRLSDAAHSSADNATATPFGGGRLAAYPVSPCRGGRP